MARYGDLDNLKEFLRLSCKNEVLFKQMSEIIDSEPTVDVGQIAKNIISDLRIALKPLTVDKLHEYPRSSYDRLHQIVDELEGKYIGNSK